MRKWLTIGILGVLVNPDRAPAQLQVNVRYPSRNAVVTATGDSTFLYGNVSDPGAVLRVAGQRIPIDPSGGWLAWIAIPRDSAFTVRISAQAGSRRTTVDHLLRRADWIPNRPVWVEARSLSPVGDVWLPPREPITFTVRAVPGAKVRLIVGPDSVVPFEADEIATPVTTSASLPRRSARYFAIVADQLNPATDGGVLTDATPQANASWPMLEVIRGTDTVRTRWPVRVTRHAGAAWVRLDDDTASTGLMDHMVNLREGRFGDYAWRLPNGTMLRADARIGSDLRVRLSASMAGWMPRAQAHAVAAPAHEGPITVEHPTVDSTSFGIRLRLPMLRPVGVQPRLVNGALEITIYDAVWRSAPPADSVVGISYHADEAGNTVVRLAPAWAIWGWRSRVDGSDVVVDVRPPPQIDSARPFAGRLIVIDAGHPPGGSCGPTGLCEPEANLAVASHVRDMLLRAGATVVMTRRGSEALELEARTLIADTLDADLLISIHHNALPDGVNPFVSVGTATYFQHAPSAPLARAIQARLVQRLGLRNLGAIRGDLALVRPTWYPSVLTEGLFLIVPAQERLARSRAGRLAYATGVVEGAAAFLRAAGVSGRVTSLVPDMSPSPRVRTFLP